MQRQDSQTDMIITTVLQCFATQQIIVEKVYKMSKFPLRSNYVSPKCAKDSETVFRLQIIIPIISY